jgi:uncharacterized protein (TIGR02594 family)
VNRTALDVARRFIGMEELTRKGEDHPFIQWGHMICGLGSNTPDEIPWCSSFANAVAEVLDLPRSKSAAARSWLLIGDQVELHDARPGFDVVVLKRGRDPQPGPEVTSGAAGHVGFFAGTVGRDVLVVGGNQGDAVTEQRFPQAQILGIRRLA